MMKRFVEDYEIDPNGEGNGCAYLIAIVIILFVVYLTVRHFTG